MLIYIRYAKLIRLNVSLAHLTIHINELLGLLIIDKDLMHFVLPLLLIFLDLDYEYGQDIIRAHLPANHHNFVLIGGVHTEFEAAIFLIFQIAHKIEERDLPSHLIIRQISKRDFLSID